MRLLFHVGRLTGKHGVGEREEDMDSICNWKNREGFLEKVALDRGSEGHHGFHGKEECEEKN